MPINCYQNTDSEALFTNVISIFVNKLMYLRQYDELDTNVNLAN